MFTTRYFIGEDFFAIKKFGLEPLDLEMRIWEILTTSVYDEFHRSYYESITKEKSEYDLTFYLENAQKEFTRLNEYSCSYLFFYRSMLLDRDQQQYFSVCSFSLNNHCIM